MLIVNVKSRAKPDLPEGEPGDLHLPGGGKHGARELWCPFTLIHRAQFQVIDLKTFVIVQRQMG